MSEFKVAKDEEESFERFMEGLVQARTSKKWMAVVWEVRDGKIQMRIRSCCNFPRGDFLQAVALLAKSCADEEEFNETSPTKGPTDLPAPLPRAVPDVKVFSMESSEEKKIDEPFNLSKSEDEKGEPEKEERPEDLLEESPPTLGFPTPTPPTQEAINENLKGLPEVNVQRYEYAVVLCAKDHLPQALPPNVSEAQITEAVEAYRAGMGATQ